MTTFMRRAIGAALGALALLPSAALADYVSISVVRGDEPSVHLYSQPGDQLSVVRGGAVVGTATSHSDAGAAVAAAAGDVITVARSGQEIYSTTFDGKPTVDPGFCGGATTMSGDVTPGAEVYAWVTRPANSGDSYAPGNERIGVTTKVDGGRFTATFSRAVPAGWQVTVGTWSGDYAARRYFNSTLSGKAGPCPVPAQAPSIANVVKDTTAPTGRLPKGKVLSGRIDNLFTSRGITSTVEVSEAGTTVEQVVFLDNGAKLTAAGKRKKARKKAVVLAKGRTVAKAPGKVKVKIKSVRSARKYRNKKVLKVAIVTTLKDPAGNVRRLPVRKQTLRG